MAVHVGIIDQDPVRLITPLLDNRTVSRHIVFIGDRSQESMYVRLHTVLNQRDITSEFFEIPAGSNIADIKASIRELAEDLKQRNLDVKLNASCGLRHRLLSVYEVFRTYHWPIFVVEPNSDRLCWLYPDGNKDTQVQDRITISDYLTISAHVASSVSKICHRNWIKSFTNWANAGQATLWSWALVLRH